VSLGKYRYFQSPRSRGVNNAGGRGSSLTCEWCNVNGGKFCNSKRFDNIILVHIAEGMADSGIHLLDVTVRPSADVENVITDSWFSLQTGSSIGEGKIVYGFKVDFLRSLEMLTTGSHDQLTA